MLPTTATRKTESISQTYPVNDLDVNVPLNNQLPLYRGVDCSTNQYNNRVNPYKMLATIDTSPENKSAWFKDAPRSQNDQVRENVINGIWLCNFEPNQQENYYLCRRNFFLEPNTSVPPFQRGQQVDNESYLRPAISKNECWGCRRN